MPDPRSLTRRVFLGAAASAGAGFLLGSGRGASSWSSGGGARNATEPGSGSIQPFPLERVRLLPGPLRDAQELNSRYLLSLPQERLLHTFRVNAGLPSSAEPVGGWGKPDC